MLQPSILPYSRPKLFALNKFSIGSMSNILMRENGEMRSKLSRSTGEQVHFPHLI